MSVAPGATRLPHSLLRVLADPLRMRIVELLAVEELCTCHLVAELGTTQSNVSNHLRVLRQAGLVAAEPGGRFTWYRLDASAVRALSASLSALADGATRAGRRPC
jgi:ArsR family transcriptional regulator